MPNPVVHISTLACRSNSWARRAILRDSRHSIRRTRSERYVCTRHGVRHFEPTRSPAVNRCWCHIVCNYAPLTMRSSPSAAGPDLQHGDVRPCVSPAPAPVSPAAARAAPAPVVPAPFELPRNQSAYAPADSPLLLTALYPPLAAVSNRHTLSTSRAATVSTGILNYDWDDLFPPVPLATAVIHPSHGGARG